ncbi:MAG: c-type cytochrome [Bacteroidota bacterium]|nr:c-type cytochrome [Bacteroidota bacterium]
MIRFITLCTVLIWAAEASAQQANDLGTDEQREAGKVLYDIKCAHCHGYSGDAISVATPFVRPTPRDFTSGNYKSRSTASGELPTTEDIRRSIRLGMPYTSMPAWEGILSEAEITNLAYYLKSFDAAFAGPYGNPTVVEVPPAPGYSDDPDHLARGRAVFEANQCADCHGDNGRGNGLSAPDLEDEWGFHIRPADMTKRWTYRASSTREDIYRTFMTGLNGTPMPSYQQSIEEADRWALVDYVWSLSRSTPDYGTVATAIGQSQALDLGDPLLFADAPEAYFPIVGQVIEPGREFNPGVNGIAVRAVFDTTHIALQLRWHDMTAETASHNHPSLPAPLFNPAQADTSAGDWSDAVALLWPAATPVGLERPYFMFGDTKNPMSIWFADLATDSAAALLGQGTGLITESDWPIESTAGYEDGMWTIVMKGPRRMGEMTFEERAFVPVSFSVWDGFNRERGNKRGLSAWYHIYMEPIEQESVLLPMAKWALIVLLVELALVGLVRWRAGRRDEY